MSARKTSLISPTMSAPKTFGTIYPTQFGNVGQALNIPLYSANKYPEPVSVTCFITHKESTELVDQTICAHPEIVSQETEHWGGTRFIYGPSLFAPAASKQTYVFHFALVHSESGEVFDSYQVDVMVDRVPFWARDWERDSD
ncbi:hypothetical protein CC79DRAFT_1364602 [Sarocladium strictum]